jgi:hypothetical protein
MTLLTVTIAVAFSYYVAARQWPVLLFPVGIVALCLHVTLPRRRRAVLAYLEEIDACVHCGYRLVGGSGRQCPECGSEVPRHSDWRPGVGFYRIRRPHVLVLIATGCAALAIGWWLFGSPLIALVILVPSCLVGATLGLLMLPSIRGSR